MAQTYKDFITECEAFPYSRQNFELMKECTEIDLLSKMIENHYVLQELALDSVQFESTTYTTEGYQIEVLEESVGDKLRSLSNKLITLITGLLDKLAGFIKTKSDKLKAKMISNDTITRLNAMSDEERTKVLDNYEKSKKRGKFTMKFVNKNEAPKQQKVSILKSMKALLSANKIMNEATDAPKLDANEPWDEYLKTIKNISTNKLAIVVKSDGPIPASMADLIKVYEEFNNLLSGLNPSNLKNNKSAEIMDKIFSDNQNLPTEYTFIYNSTDTEANTQKINTLKKSISDKITALSNTAAGEESGAAAKTLNTIRKAYTRISRYTADVMSAETACMYVVNGLIKASN